MIHWADLTVPYVVPFTASAAALEALDEVYDKPLLRIILIAGVHVGGGGVADEGVILEVTDTPAVHLVHLQQHTVKYWPPSKLEGYSSGLDRTLLQFELHFTTYARALHVYSITTRT